MIANVQHFAGLDGMSATNRYKYSPSVKDDKQKMENEFKIHFKKHSRNLRGSKWMITTSNLSIKSKRVKHFPPTCRRGYSNDTLDALAGLD